MGTCFFPSWPNLTSIVVGHCMFSRMWINTSAGLVSGVALAPVAVHPNHQREGTGSRLIQHGLELLRAQGEKIIIVVGHPAYYPDSDSQVLVLSASKARFPERYSWRWN